MMPVLKTVGSFLADTKTCAVDRGFKAVPDKWSPKGDHRASVSQRADQFAVLKALNKKTGRRAAVNNIVLITK